MNRSVVAVGRAERDVSWDLRGALPLAKTKHLAAITDPKEVGPLLRVLDGYPGRCPCGVLCVWRRSSSSGQGSCAGPSGPTST